MHLTTGRRNALSTLLALVLAVESVTVVAAAAQTSVGLPRMHALPDASPAGLVLAESSAGGSVSGATVARMPPAVAAALEAGDAPAVPVVGPKAASTDAPTASTQARAAIPNRAARATTSSAASSRATSSRAGTTGSAAHTGRNHLWIPGLNVNRSVSLFPCDRASPPDNLVYRWGCAGANNIYLMGHAYSVFKPLHDAYVAGRLAVGMKAWYADSQGRVHVYVVQWWKTTLPTNAGWAWAAQSRSSMTLQTCVGANSRYRLVVRLVEVGG